MNKRIHCLIWTLIVIAGIVYTSNATQRNQYMKFYRNQSEYASKIAELCIKSSDSSMILFLVHPGVSTRLEGITSDIALKLRSSGYNSYIGCVYGYRKFDAAKRYSNERDYSFDVLIDTSLSFFNEIGFTYNPPIVTKWNKQGQLLNVMPISGDSILKPDFWEELLYNTKPITCRTVIDTHYTIPSQYLADLEAMNVDTDKTVDLSEAAKVHGRLLRPVVSPDANLLLATDGLFGDKKIYSLDDGTYKGNLKPDKQLRRQHSMLLSESDFSKSELSQSATILFSGMFINDSVLGISTTIPKIDSINGQPGFVNKAVILYYSMPEGDLSRVLPIHDAYNIETKILSSHVYQPIISEDKIVLRCRKGYPTVGVKPSDSINTGNPYRESFYDDCPLFALFSPVSGKRIKYIGNLAEIYKLNRRGYIASYQQIEFDSSGQYYISHALDTTINVNGIERLPLKHYYNPDFLKKSDREIASIESAVDSLRNNIGGYICRMNVVGDSLIVLWKINTSTMDIVYSESFIVQKYDLSKKTLIMEKKLDSSVFPGYRLDAITFARSQIVCIVSNSTKTKCIFLNF